jgi:sulfate transport system substrate-binding protein
VFLVRKGILKETRDWGTCKEGVEVITPNPKHPGRALNYLAAWAFAAEKFSNDETQIKAFMKKLFLNVPILDTGARGATTTFVQRQIGDVLLAWENEAFLAINELGKDQFEIVMPSMSILAEPSVTVVDTNAQKHDAGSGQYHLGSLYTPEAQQIIGENYFARPTASGSPVRPAVSLSGWLRSTARLAGGKGANHVISMTAAPARIARE